MSKKFSFTYKYWKLNWEASYLCFFSTKSRGLSKRMTFDVFLQNRIRWIYSSQEDSHDRISRKASISDFRDSRLPVESPFQRLATRNIDRLSILTTKNSNKRQLSSVILYMEKFLIGIDADVQMTITELRQSLKFYNNSPDIFNVKFFVKEKEREINFNDFSWFL